MGREEEGGSGSRGREEEGVSGCRGRRFTADSSLDLRVHRTRNGSRAHTSDQKGKPNLYRAFDAGSRGVLLLPSVPGYCTACGMRVKSGQLYQLEALGISAELKAKESDDYALELAMAHE
ncbi:unnamed protein product [Sphagnum balticum]